MRHTPCGYCPPASSGFLRTQRNAFLNPFFSFSARKKRTVSTCQEKKEGTVPTVVQKFSQKISAFIRPLRQTLPPERSLRSAHRLSAELRRKIAPKHSPSGKVPSRARRMRVGEQKTIRCAVGRVLYTLIRLLRFAPQPPSPAGGRHWALRPNQPLPLYRRRKTIEVAPSDFIQFADLPFSMICVKYEVE